MNGSTAGVSVAGATITADYSAAYGPLEPGETVVLRFRATLDAGPGGRHDRHEHRRRHVERPAADGERQRLDRRRRHPRRRRAERHGLARRQFRRRAGHRRARARRLDGRAVPRRQARALGADGRRRRLSDQRRRAERRDRHTSTSCGSARRARARTPRSSARAASPFTNALQRITDIVVPSGSNLQDLNLPIDPNGVVYNSISRTPVAGATLDAAARGQRRAAAGELLLRPAQQGQVTLADGYYKFDLNFSDPACPSGGELPPRRDVAAGDDLRRRLLADHSAGVRRVDRRVLGAGVPGQRRRRDSGHGPVLRGAGSEFAPGSLGAGAHARARATTCT